MHYGFTTIYGSRFTGPRCDKYLTYILYSSIKHKHLAFNNLNTRVKLSNSLSDTHFLILFFRPLHSYQYTVCSQYTCVFYVSNGGNRWLT